MSLLSIDDWNEFLFNVGQDFYDLVHDTGDQYTDINYPLSISYYGAYTIYNNGGMSRDYSVPVLGWFTAQTDVQTLFEVDTVAFDSNITSYYAKETGQPTIFNAVIKSPNSYIGYSHNYFLFNDKIWMRNASNEWKTDIFQVDIDLETPLNSNPDYILSSHQKYYGKELNLNQHSVSLSRDVNGVSYYFSNSPQLLFDWYNLSSPLFTPSIVKDYPVIINSNNYDSNYNTYYNYVQNLYIDNGDSITNYTYNIDNNNYITVNYSTDGNGVPTGFIDVKPTGNISFDDLFDMFNTILAPLVGVGLDIPDWNTYLPPVVTGDINVNIDIPDVTGQYPAETITPLDSDVYNIMPLDSLPQLPSLTGIDNGETAAALGSSFTFMDGCGLLMPFVTVAIIRLLISKFRGDS